MKLEQIEEQLLLAQSKNLVRVVHIDRTPVQLRPMTEMYSEITVHFYPNTPLDTIHKLANFFRELNVEIAILLSTPHKPHPIEPQSPLEAVATTYVLRAHINLHTKLAREHIEAYGEHDRRAI